MSRDLRHQKRIEVMQQVFAITFTQENLQNYLSSAETDKYILELLDNLEVIDKKISRVATERPISDVSKLDLAILRLTVFESMVKETPLKVLINEAVELAKQFGSEKSPQFVNGVLGKLLIDQKKKRYK